MKKAILWFVAVLVFTVGLGQLANATDRYYRYYDNNEIVVEQKIVKFDPDYFYGTEHLYGVGESIKRERQAEKDGEQKKLELELEVLKKKIDLLNLQLQKGGSVVGSPKEEPAEEPKVEKTPIETLFLTKCANCHGTTPKGSDLKLVINDKINPNLSVEESVKVFVHTYYPEHAKKVGLTRMPKGGAALPDEDIQTIFNWMIDKIVK